MMDGKVIILGIESSCDETAASITANGREILSNIVFHTDKGPCTLWWSGA